MSSFEAKYHGRCAACEERMLCLLAYSAVRLRRPVTTPATLPPSLPPILAAKARNPLQVELATILQTTKEEPTK